MPYSRGRSKKNPRNQPRADSSEATTPVTEDSSDDSLLATFGPRPIILQVYQILKDPQKGSTEDPNSAVIVPEKGKKKRMKKKKPPEACDDSTGESDSTDSTVSMTSVPSRVMDITKEEFYDANDIYLHIADTPPSKTLVEPAPSATLAMAHSKDQMRPPKPPTTTTEQQTSSSSQNPSIISKLQELR